MCPDIIDQQQGEMMWFQIINMKIYVINSDKINESFNLKFSTLKINFINLFLLKKKYRINFQNLKDISLKGFIQCIIDVFLSNISFLKLEELSDNTFVAL